MRTSATWTRPSLPHLQKTLLPRAASQQEGPEFTEAKRLSSSDAIVSSGLAASPVIGRAAGLPLKSIEPFASPRCASILLARTTLAGEVAVLRAHLVKVIEARLTEFDGPARRFLLSVKRDCFNGRPLRKYRKKPHWATLTGLAMDSAERVHHLEHQIRDIDARFEDVYEREFSRERLQLLEFLDDVHLLRGIAISSPGLVKKARSKALSFATSSGANPAKWEESLLRFVTRAATKLSANSTLTTYALGSLQESTESHVSIQPIGTRREFSLVRIDRPPIEQFQALLLEHPAVRRRTLVAWNESADEIEPGAFRFVRDSHWKLDTTTGEFRFVRPARIKVKFPQSFQVSAFDAILSLISPGLVYSDLLDRLETEVSDAQDTLDQLLSIGFLVLLPPWPTHEPWLERRICDFLLSIVEDEPDVREITEALEELVTLEEGYVRARRPERCVVDMQKAFTRLMRKTVPVAEFEEFESPATVATRTRFYEDVLEVPSTNAPIDRGVFQLTTSAAEELLDVVGLFSRFDSLFHRRHEVVHTLAAWWRAHEPTRREIPFEEVAEAFAPMWKTFLNFHGTSSEDPCKAWNPLSSPALTSLQEHRAWALSRVRELLEDAPRKDFLSAESLQALIERLPDRYRPLVGVSVFFQPADAEGSTWVLHSINEGTGRYLSRVVPMLRGEHRERFLGHLRARSTIEVEGEEADLLEVKHPWLHLVRAHPPQTTRVLELRGLHLDLPPERRVKLDELVLQADPESETFRLIDRTDRRVLPVSLSTLPNAGLSNKLRFLLMFGVGETRGIFPSARSHTEHGVTTSHRLTCENVVLRRKCWLIPIEELRQDLANADDISRHKIVDQWRHRLELPNEGFYRELASCGKHKPQFVRFDSPFLCRLFVRSLLQKDDATLSFSEALPAPADYPTGLAGPQQAFELLVDQLSVRDLPKDCP